MKEAQSKKAVEVIELTHVHSQSAGSFRFVEKMKPRSLSWMGMTLESIIKKAPSYPNWWLSYLLYDPKTQQLWAYIDDVDVDEDGAHQYSYLRPFMTNGKIDFNKGAEVHEYPNLIVVAAI